MSDLPLIPDYLARAKVITDALDRLYIPLRASEEALTMLRESVYMSSPGQSQWNMCLTGPSGAGKTYMLDRFQLEMKQRLCPDDPNAIPVLIVKTPEDPTLEYPPSPALSPGAEGAPDILSLSPCAWSG